jgi:hypothetical protein
MIDNTYGPDNLTIEQMLPYKGAAKAAGHFAYFTGKVCVYGHSSPRYASNGQCIECSKVPLVARPLLKKTRKALTQEEKRERRKAYNLANRERIKAYCRKYWKENKEELKQKNKEYREANKARCLEKDKEKYLRNRDRCIEKTKNYYYENRETQLEKRIMQLFFCKFGSIQNSVSRFLIPNFTTATSARKVISENGPLICSSEEMTFSGAGLWNHVIPSSIKVLIPYPAFLQKRLPTEKW